MFVSRSRQTHVKPGKDWDPVRPAFRGVMRLAGLPESSCSAALGRFAARRRRKFRRIAEAAVKIKSDLLGQMLDAILEEMIGAGNHRMLDCYALLGLELLDKAGDFLQGSDAILISMHEKTGGRTGREKGKIEAVGGGRNRDETFDFRPPHQELHADPGAKRDSGDPAGARFGIESLRPVEGGCRVRQFALTVIEAALRSPDAAKIETQHGKSALGESVIEIVDDLIVHRPAELRMRM